MRQCKIMGQIFQCKNVAVFEKEYTIFEINSRFNNDLHFQEFSCLNAVFKAVGPALVKEGKV